MFTTQDPQDIVVLKTAAFRHATRRARHRMLASEASTASPLRAVSQVTLCPNSHEAMRGAHNTDSGRESLIATTTARSVPCFTFKLPIRPAARPDASTGAGGGGISAPRSQVARAALEEALQKHEAALRSWADEPAQHISPSTMEAIGVHLGPAAVLSSATQPPQGLEKLHTGVVRMHFQPSAGDSASRVAALAQPYCRVLAQGSMAGTGVPTQVVPTRTSAEVAISGAAMEAHHDAKCGGAPEALSERSRDDGYAASASSSSCAPQAQRDHQIFVPLARRAALTSGAACTSRHGMPLVPYQLPLRMRPSVPGPALPNAPAATRSPSPPAETTRRAFLDEQAKRYAQWRSRQAAVLHQLAPDMWDRALPHYAALDRQPRAMDSGLRNHASHVRRSQYDSGVVFV
ncbi:hypothetical protein CGC21_0815 [Leishmania donovani]|uniref:Uncharacterized protein n=1 Tax=Leishmania donovani TaxID=5661 RepID=A0A3S7WRM0_LEIDO|nr:hypothetical protein LdCL_110014300 [Leishmania donovani]TPP53011.1 hypothetical protein CGC21_0815 [Leishmania donovani]